MHISSVRPLLQPLFKHISISLIAPHGMTDIIHAKQFRHVLPLYNINIASIIGSYILTKNNQEQIINILFVISSIAHFRHDIPTSISKRFFFKIPKFILISIFLLYCVFQNPTMFFAYMSLVHVPRHYISNWRFIKDQPVNNISFMIICTFLFTLAGNKLNHYLDNIYFLNIIKGVIISHILYEEWFIYRHKNKLLFKTGELVEKIKLVQDHPSILPFL